MATKVKFMKLLSEMREFAEFGRRPALPKPTALFLMQLRSHVVATTHMRRRLIIKTDAADTFDFPHPVKITHLNPPTVAGETSNAS